MASPISTAEFPAEHQDRKAGLVIFGVLTMLLGGVFALMSLGLALMAFHPPPLPNGAPATNPQSMVLAVAEYVFLAVAMVWLGIGSILGKRWARALLLIFSWSWLVMGVLMLGMMAFTLPHIMDAAKSTTPAGQPGLPAEGTMIIMVISMTVSSVMFVIVPGVWVLFYRSKNVKATCEALDPAPRWTDRRPLPVIAVSLWLALGAAMMLLIPVAYKGVVPFFGMFITGSAGVAIYVLLGIVWGWSAWALYQLDRRGWWLILASVVIFGISAFITYSRHDISEVYALMGYSEAQLEQIQKFNFMKGQTMAWMTLGFTAPFVAYLVYIRKFLPPRMV